MGIIISRYMDPTSSEGAIIKFIIESYQLVHTICTSETYFPELTPWNVIDFQTDEMFNSLPFYDLFSLQTHSFSSDWNHNSENLLEVNLINNVEDDINEFPTFQEEFDDCTEKYDLFYYGRQDVTAVI